MNKKLRLTHRFQNLVEKLSRWRSLILAVLLFFLSIPVPLLVAQVSFSSPIIQTQQDTSQLVEQGQKHYQAEEFEAAAIVWQEAADALAAGGDKLNQAMALSNLSLTEQQLGKWDEAKTAISQSLNLLQTLPKTPEKENYPNLGAIYLSLGNTARALGNKKLVSRQTQPPVTSLKPAACIPGTNYDTAVEFYQQAADCYRQAESEASPTITTQAQLNLLSLSIQTQQGGEIAALLPTIQAQINRLPLSQIAVSAQLKLAQNLLCLQAKLSQEKLGKAGNFASLSSPILQSCPVRQTAKKPNGNALNLAQIPSLPEIRQQVRMVLHQVQILGDKQAEANALGYLAAVSQQMGKWEEAQQLTEQALQQLSAFDKPELVYLWQWQLGRLYQLQGKPKEFRG